MNLSYISKLVLLITIVVLLGNSLAISRSYQDSWVLEGLEIPFFAFVITYSISFFLEKRIKSIVMLAAIGRFVFVLIPNLKYDWFLGRSIDQHGQYYLANQVYSKGEIATQYSGSTGFFYASTPLMHLLFAVFSIILNVPVLYSFKYIPVLLSSIFPLLTYSIMKDLKFPKGTSALKYALFISSVPIAAGWNYIVSGSLFGTFLVFLVLCQIVRLLQKNDRLHWAVLIFFVFALAAAHSASSAGLTILLLMIALLQNIPSIKIKSYLKKPTILAMVLVATAWLTFSAEGALYRMTSELPDVLAGTTPEMGYIPFNFFKLVYANISGALRSVIVYNGADVFLLLLTIGGLIIIFWKTRKGPSNDLLKFLSVFNAGLLLFLVIGVSLRVGDFFWNRIVGYARISFAIFSSVFILHMTKRRTWHAVILSSIILLATLQLYEFQPLIPPAKTLSADLPSNEPIVYVVNVNSIYQRKMIKFAEAYITSRIACDKVTLNQIVGLTEYNFSRRVIWYYPIARLADKNIVEKDYDFFLIHLPGKSGAFSEPAQMRTRELILDTMNNSSVVYTNGESYILSRAPS